MNTSTVFLVDDEASVRESVSLLLETVGFRVEAYDCAQAFLAAWSPEHDGCLLLDMRMPGMSGEELQAELGRRASALPIIFMSAYGDVPTTVRAIQGGAVDFLTKPVNGADLIERVRFALERSQVARDAALARKEMHARLERLTGREREILALAVAGRTNKEIARQLDISYRTIEAHRSHILLKAGVNSLLELVQMAAEAGLRLNIPGEHGE